MKNLHVSFYTEAGLRRGMGHLIRCYTIYEKFKSNGVKVKFYLDSDIDFNYKFGDIEYFKWENIHFDTSNDILFIDSYEADIEIYNNVSKAIKVPVFIDDYGRLDYPEGIIINFAPEADKMFPQSKKKKSHYFLGLNYIPIREEFLHKPISKEHQLFIMLGGHDTANLSLEIVDILKDIDIKKIVVSNNESTIAQLNYYENVEAIFRPSDTELVEKMAKSTFAISTTSMAVYELSYCMVPTIILAVSKNQELGVTQLIRHQLAESFVDIKVKNCQNDMILKVNKLINSDPSINRVIDGKGTQRILDQTVKLAMR